MMKIVQDLITENLWKTKCPYKMTPQFIVIHNTANDASAKNEVSYMKKSPAQVSFHFAVDDKETVQAIPLSRNAWHAGDGASGEGNRRGIAIEICFSKSGGEKYEKAEENAAKLCADLLKEYGWTTKNIRKHQDFSGKYCPHRTLDRGWAKFVKKVEKYMCDLAEKDEIIRELADRGIITNLPLWSQKLEEDENVYWFARKTANYIRGL